jgi:hypothetical protein
MAPSNPVRVEPWSYTSGVTVAGNDQAATAVVIPRNANVVEIAAETEDVYYAINAGNANANSPGYIVAGGREIVGPLDNWVSLYVFQASGGPAHSQWFLQKNTTKGN